MARGTHEHMLAVAEKKPQLKTIIDNIAEYTTEELKVIQGQPGWIKKRLVEYKEVAEKRQANAERWGGGYLTPDEIADRMADSSGCDAASGFPAYQYNGEDINIGGNLQLEVSPGDYILLLRGKKIKVNPTVIDVSDKDIHRILSNSTALGEMNINEYNFAMQSYLGNKHSGDYSLGGIMSRGVRIG